MHLYNQRGFSLRGFHAPPRAINGTSNAVRVFYYFAPAVNHEITPPLKALQPAYRRTPVVAHQFERFASQLDLLLQHLDHEESEEHAKTHVRDFLQKVWYAEKEYYVNTKGRIDLAIHLGPKATSPLAVIIEAKRPQNRSEFPTPDNLNCKALHELLRYFLQERLENKNLSVRHLVMTNGWQWYIIDAVELESKINSKLQDQYNDWARQGHKTDVFYKEIASPFFNNLDNLGHVVLVDFKKLKEEAGQNMAQLLQASPALQRRATALYKLLSPQHLLKEPLRNDQNTLNQGFYRELLHIVGLHEFKDTKTKKLLIDRLPADKRQPGSLLENTITSLRTEDCLANLNADDRRAYGATEEEQLFSLAFSLCISWLNRVLFLKLLEAQLRRYHPGHSEFAFLNPARLDSFFELNKLFFQVLALKPADRNADVAQRYGHIPYLNSSLFDTTDAERHGLQINRLDAGLTLQLHPQTVLKDEQGLHRLTGSLNALNYLLRFLDAYNFSSEGGGEIQQENKALINAKVLGLFFEKINGYKDGSVYTPDYITEYMCAQTIRRAVVDKFARHFKEDFADYNELLRWADRNLYKGENMSQAVQLIDNLRLCDPAVGSGHFLVSALNELIVVKNQLGLLLDELGQPLNIDVVISQDELIVTDRKTNDIIEYNAAASPHVQRVQRTLFVQKQRLIENCLFGVDINPNSVKICQLRLWIELLKNAYYNNDRQLETLPNIDINIKTGNSLVSRVPLDGDLSQVFKGANKQFSHESYLDAVRSYRTVRDRKSKREIADFIFKLKQQIKRSMGQSNPLVKNLARYRGQLELAKVNVDIFGNQIKSEAKKQIEIKQLAAQIEKYEKLIEEEEKGKKWQGAFEWRYEFPEVLDENGNYTGFDIVIGNPPYIRQEELGELKKMLAENFKEVYAGTADIYQYFFQLGLSIVRPGGLFSIIVANKWMLANYGLNLRKFLKNKTVLEIIDFGDLPVFENAITYPCIISLVNRAPQQGHQLAFSKVDVNPKEIAKMDVADYMAAHKRMALQEKLSEQGWNLSDSNVQSLVEKLRKAGPSLGEYSKGKVYYGLKTGLNDAFVIDDKVKSEILSKNPSAADFIYPFASGKNVKRYSPVVMGKNIILFPKGSTKSSGGENWLVDNFPAIAKHLLPYEEQARARTDKGDYWWELRACDYYEAFEKPKIIWQEIAVYSAFTYVKDTLYSNNKTFIWPDAELWNLAILNSKTIWFFLHQVSAKLQGDALAMQTPYTFQIPIAIPSPAQKQQLEALVTQIMAAKEAGQDSTPLEAQVDQLVYQLYKLTPEEIAIVENP